MSIYQDFKRDQEEFQDLLDAAPPEVEQPPQVLRRVGGYVLIGGVFVKVITGMEVADAATNVPDNDANAATVLFDDPGDTASEGFEIARQQAAKDGRVLKSDNADEFAQENSREDEDFVKQMERWKAEYKPMPAESQFGRYHVAWGDTVSKLAKRFNVSEDAITFANGLNEAGDIFADAWLIIPNPGKGADESLNAKMLRHEVAPGQTLSDIARSNGVPLRKLIAINDIEDPDLIYAGQTILIPNPKGAFPNPPAPKAGGKMTVPAGTNLTEMAGAVADATDDPHDSAQSIIEQLVASGVIDDPDKVQAEARVEFPGVSQADVAEAEQQVIAHHQAPAASPAAPTPATEADPVQPEIPVKVGEFIKDWRPLIPVGPDKPYKTAADVDAFLDKVATVSGHLQISPDYLMATMYFETAHTFDPGIVNFLGYTGLIQFGEEAAAQLGTTQEALRNMSAIEQLDYVLGYFESSAGQMPHLEDVYLKVFLPAFIGKGPDFIIPHKYYQANHGFDANLDGNITILEISARIWEAFNTAPMLSKQPKQPITPPKAEKPEPKAEANPDQSKTEQDPYAFLKHPLVEKNTIRVESNGYITVEVRDIRVNIYSANDLGNLLVAADEAGFHLTAASDFRSPEEQQQLREQNCPDPINSRPGECSPATGYADNPDSPEVEGSQHQIGESVDFRANGQPLTSWKHPAVLFLLDRAIEYNFTPDVPSEPWHWGNHPKLNKPVNH